LLRLRAFAPRRRETQLASWKRRADNSAARDALWRAKKYRRKIFFE
jgi:hypothetical protein